jgi:hypothetical protein
MRYVLLLAFLTACPSPEGEDAPAAPAFCQTFAFAACGGDPSGSWRLQQACPAFEERRDQALDERPECTGSRQVVVSSGVSMDAEFGAGRYTISGTTPIDLSLNVEQGCLDAMRGEPSDLAAYCAALETQLSESFPSAACVIDDGDCLCTAQESSDYSDSGTYSVSGGTLTTTSDDPESGTDSIELCVEPGRLLLHGDSEDPEVPARTLIFVP